MRGFFRCVATKNQPLCWRTGADPILPGIPV
nr:MAG TPA: hypothetical protein [Caudoviricetes sp.]